MGHSRATTTFPLAIAPAPMVTARMTSVGISLVEATIVEPSATDLRLDTRNSSKSDTKNRALFLLSGRRTTAELCTAAHRPCLHNRIEVPVGRGTNRSCVTSTRIRVALAWSSPADPTSKRSLTRPELVSCAGDWRASVDAAPESSRSAPSHCRSDSGPDHLRMRPPGSIAR